MKPFGWAKAFQYSLALVGAVLLIASCVSLGEGLLFQWRPRFFTHDFSSETVDRQRPANKEVIPPLHTLVMAEQAPRDLQILGRFEIPRLHVSTLVVEGDGEKSLRLGVGHVPGSALSGPQGNTVLAGHRDTFFRCLRRIRIGDEVDFDVAGERNRYQITGTRIVSPSDVDVMKSTSAGQLTLITCYPFGFIGSAPNRLVVEATPLAQTAALPIKRLGPSSR